MTHWREMFSTNSKRFQKVVREQNKMADETFLVNLTIDGKDVTVGVTADLVEALNSNDPMRRHHAYELVAKALQTDAENHERNELANIQLGVGLDCGVLETTDGSQAAGDSMVEGEELGGSEGTVQWCHEAVMLLISLYAENKELFSHNVYKQKDVWRKIANGMQEKGYKFQPHYCDDKWCSLKHRHKVIVDNKTKSGWGGWTWQYYDAMDEVLARDPAVRPVRVMGSSQNVQESTEIFAAIRSKPPLPPATMYEDTLTGRAIFTLPQFHQSFTNSGQCRNNRGYTKDSKAKEEWW